jgi:UDP-arabinose 4-epimerase
MARVLITGGAGYIGSHCAKALAAAGHEGVVFDNFSTGHRDFVRWGPCIEGDIRDPAALGAALADFRIDAVIHFAALAHVGESIRFPDQYYDVNVNGTRVLLEAMVRAKVKRTVFSSSCAVYGEPDRMPILEETPLRPVNPYGFTKFVCERMLEDFERAYACRSARLRYFNAAGADPSGELGEDHTPKRRIVSLALDAALGIQPAVGIFGTDYETPDGTAIRDYVHVSDLARAHVLALHHLLEGGATIAVNLGTGHGASVRQVIGLARRITGTEIVVRGEKRRAGDPATLVAAPALASKLLGWSADCSGLETIISDAWRWHRQRFSRSARND